MSAIIIVLRRDQIKSLYLMTLRWNINRLKKNVYKFYFQCLHYSKDLLYSSTKVFTLRSRGIPIKELSRLSNSGTRETNTELADETSRYVV